LPPPAVKFYLKSYGQAWEGSKVLVTIKRKSNYIPQLVTGQNNTNNTENKSTREGGNSENNTTREGDRWTTISEQTLYGIHESKTSLTYDQEIRFPVAIDIGSDVQVTIQLVGGTSFKIMGMMICPR